MKRKLYFTALGISLFAIPPAFGADGYVTGDVNLRAGPDSSYPSVVMLPAGAEVAIEGCIDGWSWCDVAAGNDRGWVAGNFLQEEYQGRRVLLPEYGLRIGIPVVSFVFGTYWDDNYRNRSWYGSREHWSHIEPRYHPAGAHGDRRDNRHDRMHEDASLHGRNTSYDASRAPGREAGAAARPHGSATTYRSRQNRPSRPATPQHAVATRRAERNVHAFRATGPRTIDSRASAPRSVAMHNAPPPGAGAEHKTAARKTSRKPAAPERARGKKDKNGKDEH